MSVNRINHSQENRAEAVQSPNSQKSPAVATKANAVNGQGSRAHSEPAAQAKTAATADNDAGRKQGKQENTGNDTNGTRVNVFA